MPFTLSKYSGQINANEKFPDEAWRRISRQHMIRLPSDQEHPPMENLFTCCNWSCITKIRDPRIKLCNKYDSRLPANISPFRGAGHFGFLDFFLEFVPTGRAAPAQGRLGAPELLKNRFFCFISYSQHFIVSRNCFIEILNLGVKWPLWLLRYRHPSPLPLQWPQLSIGF